MTQQEIDLSKLVKDIVYSFQERFPLRPCNSFVEEAIFIQGETLLIQILVNNLLDNANKYSPGNMPIAIHLQSVDQKIILTVIFCDLSC
jgi:K+-sensing histidine kinase KdpD